MDYFLPVYTKMERFLKKKKAVPLKKLTYPIISGYRAGPLKFSKRGEIAVIKVGNILDTGVDWSGIQFVIRGNPANSEAFRIDAGDILVCRKGVGGAGRGKLTLCAHLKHSACIYGHVHLVRTKEQKLSPYVTVFLKSKFGKLQIERFTSGVASPTLDKDDLERILIIKPSPRLIKLCENGYADMSVWHNKAMEVKERLIQRGLSTNEAEQDSEYQQYIQKAEGVLKDLIQKTEEIIEGKRKRL